MLEVTHANPPEGDEEPREGEEIDRQEARKGDLGVGSLAPQKHPGRHPRRRNRNRDQGGRVDRNQGEEAGAGGRHGATLGLRPEKRWHRALSAAPSL